MGAVKGVLNAWSNWSVYNSNFIFELHSKFDGKEVVKIPDIDKIVEPSNVVELSIDETPQEKLNAETGSFVPKRHSKVVWKPAEDDPASNNIDGEQLEDEEMDDVGNDIDMNKFVRVDGTTLLDEELDGEPLEDDEELEGFLFSDVEFQRIE